MNGTNGTPRDGREEGEDEPEREPRGGLLASIQWSYIDITGVADGQYVMVVEQNLSRGVIEADYTNNTASACVEISGDFASAC